MAISRTVLLALALGLVAWPAAAQRPDRQSQARTQTAQSEATSSDQDGVQWTRELFHEYDRNGDGVISRSEWPGDPADFDQLDRNDDGKITLAEFLVGGDGSSNTASRGSAREARNEHQSQRERADRPTGTSGTKQASNPAYRAGYDRGHQEGVEAGRGDRRNGHRWNLGGQEERMRPDSGFDPRVGSRADYETGFRAGFRLGYRAGYYERKPR